MSLDDYIDQDESQQKQTHITMANPDHPDVEPNYTSEDEMREHFQAANAVQDSRIDRRQIVGDFLVAVDESLHGENEDAVEEFLAELQE
jgi:hypothetical protein